MASRDENADCSKTGPTPPRESKMRDCPDYFYRPEIVPTGNMNGNKKDRPAG